MATYLSGITDYIPQIQPYQPDLNMMASVLQTKDAQYQAGYDKISGIYGTLLNSNMTHAENIERRDRYFTQVDNEIKKIAGLDLSKPQNVQAASQVFKPLVDDKYIHKDMAFTQSYERGMRVADNYRRCVGDDCDGEWWETGELELAYKRKEFADASLDETLGMGNLKYTPFHNAFKDAIDLAKEMGFEPESITMTPDGRYRIKTTNGSQMVPHLAQYMMASVGNDPKYGATYKSQAYVERKNFISSHADTYGGEEQAEREYFAQVFGAVEAQNEMYQQQLEEQSRAVDNKKKVVNENKKTGINPDYDKDPEALLLGLDEQQSVIDANKKQIDAQVDLSNPDVIPKLPVDVLRNRVDSLVAYGTMQDTLLSAAQTYANLTQKVDMEADEYAILEVQDRYKRGQIRLKAQLEAEAEQTLMDKLGLLDGIATVGGSGQTEGGLDLYQHMEDQQAALTSHIGAVTENNSLDLVEMVNRIIADPSTTPARKQELERMLIETYGVLETSTTVTESPSFGERLTKFATGAYIGGWDFMKQAFTDGKGIKHNVDQEGYLTRDNKGRLKLAKGWENMSFSTDPNSNSNILKVEQRLTDLATSEDFKQAIKGSHEAGIMKHLYKSMIDARGTKAELTLFQEAHAENNEYVLDKMRVSNPDYTTSTFLGTAIEQLLDQNGNVRSVQEFAQAMQPILDQFPNETDWDWSSAAKGALRGYTATSGLMGIGAPVEAIRRGRVPVSRLDPEDRMDLIESLYKDISENFHETYMTHTPDLRSEYTSINGTTGIHAGGITYTGDPIAGVNAQSNLVIGQMLGVLQQSGLLTSPSTLDAEWYVGEGSAINSKNAKDLYNSEDEDLITRMMGQIATDFLTASPKSKNKARPRLNMTTYGIAKNDHTKMAITFTPDQLYAGSLKGSENIPGLFQKLFGENAESGSITLIVPKDKLSTYRDSSGNVRSITALERHNLTREERMFNLDGSYTLDYGDWGGKAIFRNTDGGGIVMESEGLKTYENGEWVDIDKETVYFNSGVSLATAIQTANKTLLHGLENNMRTINKGRK